MDKSRKKSAKLPEQGLQEDGLQQEIGLVGGRHPAKGLDKSSKKSFKAPEEGVQEEIGLLGGCHTAQGLDSSSMKIPEQGSKTWTMNYWNCVYHM